MSVRACDAHACLTASRVLACLHAGQLLLPWLQRFLHLLVHNAPQAWRQLRGCCQCNVGFHMLLCLQTSSHTHDRHARKHWYVLMRGIWLLADSHPIRKTAKAHAKTYMNLITQTLCNPYANTHCSQHSLFGATTTFCQAAAACTCAAAAVAAARAQLMYHHCPQHPSSKVSAHTSPPAVPSPSAPPMRM